VNSECNLHISVVLAICVPKNYQIWWRFDEVLTKTSWVIFWYTLYIHSWIFNEYSSSRDLSTRAQHVPI